ncbi:MAG: polyhydroxyalkanoic acid system family protein [Chitinophagaceae bacterium]|nr:polyhydroxyalkanoic acid system family protein [Chitinophagaceae bacterium]MCW5926935.1 polyhydroxyalkanoic acid system family protein [Chitinophagaceae bacterium]
MKIEIPHDHSRDEARNKIKNLLADLKEKYAGQVKDVDETWTDYRNDFALAMGPLSTKGYISVEDKLVEIELEIPLFASMFKGQIKSLIEEEAKKILTR